MKVRLPRLYRLKVAATVAVPTDPASIVGPVYSLFIRGQGGDTDAGGDCLAVESADTACTVLPGRALCKYRSH